MTVKHWLPALSLTLACAACPAATLIEGATILTLADGDETPFEGHLLMADGRIQAVGTGPYEGDLLIEERIDARGKLLIPGFVSGHSHLWQSAFRGLAQDQELYGWLQALHWTYGEAFEVGDFYTFTLHGALDQLAHGITTTYSHSQRLGATETLYLESLEASFAAGQHFVFAYNPDLSLTPERIRAAVDDFVLKARAFEDPLLLGLSLNSVGSYRNAPDKFALEMELARRYGMTAQIHYLEEYNRRFVERKRWPDFQAAGAVGENISYAHFIHVSDKILNDAAAAGAAMIWNPLSNGRLASGLADIPRYQEAGLGVGMGVDGAASADIADPFENMRMGLYALRMQTRNAKVMSPLEILRLHTLATARVLQVDDEVGSLEVGKRADLLLVDPAYPATGAVFDPAATLVFTCSAANIVRVYVAGALKVSRGNVLDHQTDPLQAELVKRVQRIRTATETR